MLYSFTVKRQTFHETTFVDSKMGLSVVAPFRPLLLQIRWPSVAIVGVMSVLLAGDAFRWDRIGNQNGLGSVGSERHAR